MILRKIFDNLLAEELYGNIAVVYHRFEGKKDMDILNGNYKNMSHIDFEKHNGGIYTTYEMNPSGSNNMDKYGDKILKLAIKGLDKYMFLDFDEYKRLINPKADMNTYIDEQLKKFGIEKYFSKWYREDMDHVDFSSAIEKSRLFNRVHGIVYYGEQDGECVLIYNNKNVLPLAVSSDNGKTWKKYSDIVKENGSGEAFSKRKEAYFKQDNGTRRDKNIYKRGKVPQSLVREMVRLIPMINTEKNENREIYYHVGDDGTYYFHSGTYNISFNKRGGKNQFPADEPLGQLCFAIFEHMTKTGFWKKRELVMKIMDVRQRLVKEVNDEVRDDVNMEQFNRQVPVTIGSYFVRTSEGKVTVRMPDEFFEFTYTGNDGKKNKLLMHLNGEGRFDGFAWCDKDIARKARKKLVLYKKKWTRALLELKREYPELIRAE